MRHRALEMPALALSPRGVRVRRQAGGSRRMTVAASVITGSQWCELRVKPRLHLVLPLFLEQSPVVSWSVTSIALLLSLTTNVSSSLDPGRASVPHVSSAVESCRHLCG